MTKSDVKLNLKCCIPEPTCSNSFTLELHEAVRVTCTNPECSQSGYMHQKCFNVWEENVLNFMKCRGRSRSWNDSQRRANVWTGKGYSLAYKACNCKCGHGYLKKDLDWKPPVSPNIGQSENISIDKKKKREKTKLRPKLNYNNRDTKDIELMEDISNDINNVKIVNNVQNARTIGNKIDIIQDDDERKGKNLGMVKKQCHTRSEATKGPGTLLELCARGS